MKVKVFSAFRWICVYLLTLDIAAWTLIILFGGLSEDSVFFWCTIVIFSIVLPAIIFIVNILAMENVIIFDNQGISRKRFGRIIRHFDWKEIKTISTTTDNSYSAWIYFSNEVKSFDYFSTTRMQLDKKVIYLHMSKKAKTALQMFAPESWKEYIEKL